MTRDAKENESAADALNNTAPPPHAPAGDTEEVYFEGAPQLRGELLQVALWMVIGIVLIVIPFIYRFFQGNFPPGWVTALMIVAGLVVVFFAWLSVKTTKYRISNYRIDFERGVITKRIDTLELWHVDDISFYQSPLDRILGVGSIVIASNDKSTPQLKLDGLPNPRPIFDALKQRVIAVKRQRGVIKMDVG